MSNGGRMSKDIDPTLFRETLGHYPTGVAAVTAVAGDGQPVGMIVGTFSAVSMDPPLTPFYSMSSSRGFAQVQTAAAFCVNVLASGQEPVLLRFANAGDSEF